MSITGFNCEICGALDNYPHYYDDLPTDMCRTCARDVGGQTPGEYEALLRQREKHLALERRIADASGRVTYVGYPGVLNHSQFSSIQGVSVHDRHLRLDNSVHLSLDAENDTWMFGTFDDTTNEGKVMLTAFALKLDPDVSFVGVTSSFGPMTNRLMSQSVTYAISGGWGGTFRSKTP